MDLPADPNDLAAGSLVEERLERLDQLYLKVREVNSLATLNACTERVKKIIAGEIKENIDGVATAQGSSFSMYSGCIFSSYSSVCASRTEDSKLIDFRHRSTTHSQLVEIVDVEGQLSRSQFPRKDIQWIRRKKVFVNADDVFAKIKLTRFSSKMLENLEMAIKPMCSKHTSKKTAAASQLLFLESASYVSVKEKDDKFLEAKLNQENLKLKHQSDIEKLQAELSRSSIDYLKVCNAFTPRGIMERFEFDYKLPRKLEYHGLKMDRHGWWSLAIMEEQSNFCKCLVKNGMDLKQVPDISTSLYAIFSAKIHNSYPQLIVKIDGRVSMTAGRLTKTR
uniref:Uncharacterized protein n=1 Tax=Ditylenchus dipsaci TaxID=166011 RepID=A0A915DMH5_9BILA